MVQRTALSAATVVAGLVLAVGLVIAGVLPGGQSRSPAVAEAAAVIATVTDPSPEPTIHVDTVYLTPTARPEVITVTKTEPATHAGDGENEGDDD